MKYTVVNPLRFVLNEIDFEIEEYKEASRINSLAKRFLRKHEEKKNDIAIITLQQLFFMKKKKAKQLKFI